MRTKTFVTNHELLDTDLAIIKFLSREDIQILDTKVETLDTVLKTQITTIYFQKKEK